MLEIQSSEFAEDEGGSAGGTLADHQKTTRDLEALFDDGSVKSVLPSGLHSSHQAMLDKLTAPSGAAVSALCLWRSNVALKDRAANALLTS
jgi:hypothetical protein